MKKLSTVVSAENYWISCRERRGVIKINRIWKISTLNHLQNRFCIINPQEANNLLWLNGKEFLEVQRMTNLRNKDQKSLLQLLWIFFLPFWKIFLQIVYGLSAGQSWRNFSVLSFLAPPSFSGSNHIGSPQSLSSWEVHWWHFSASAEVTVKKYQSANLLAYIKSLI